MILRHSRHGVDREVVTQRLDRFLTEHIVKRLLHHLHIGTVGNVAIGKSIAHDNNIDTTANGRLL